MINKEIKDMSLVVIFYKYLNIGGRWENKEVGKSCGVRKNIRSICITN